MKLQYVVPLEILRIMVSVSQILDTKITIKSSLEVQEFRKPLTKNNDGSLILLYKSEELVKGITKLLLDNKMGKIWCEFSDFKNSRVVSSWKQLRGFFACVYACVYISGNKE